MENRKVEITSLKLKLGKTEAILTVEEARKLKKVLEDIFGKETVAIYPSPCPIIIEREVPYWIYPPAQPIWYCDNGSFQYDNNTKQLCCSIS